MTKIMINIEFLAFLENVLSSPPGVDLSAENRDQVATTGDLAYGDD